MSMEVVFPDGSMSTFSENGGSTHDGRLAIDRLRLLYAAQALKIYINSDGRMQITANGAVLAIRNVIEPITGKYYKRSMKGKTEALADCLMLIASLEHEAVVYKEDTVEPRCDVCGFFSEDADGWCGTCGCCVVHCQQFVDCPERKN